MTSEITIGTHGGTFHADEVLACVMLKLLPQFENAEIIRTRDSEKLSKLDILFANFFKLSSSKLSKSCFENPCQNFALAFFMKFLIFLKD